VIPLDAMTRAWRHKRSGDTYRIVERDVLMKMADGTWLKAVRYVGDHSSTSFVRSEKDFIENFEKVEAEG
jgi:hypothetical protein